MSAIHPDAIRDAFGRHFKAESTHIVRSPGRINLIGEHTDYNEGWAMPAAIDKAMTLALAANGTAQCRLHALDLEETFVFSLNQEAPLPGHWANYPMGMAVALRADGHRLGGFDCVFGGDIPAGAGLSSSAALACGVGLGLTALFGLSADRTALAYAAQRAEHTFAGVQCGLMDQFAVLMGKAAHALRLDCRTLAYEYVPLHLTGYTLVLANSGVKHQLADSAYNQRRAACEAGVAAAQRRYSQVRSLRDVSPQMLEAIRPEISAEVHQRCQFVLAENARVLRSEKWLVAGDLAQFGQEMYASHTGLSSQYEVSCPELDLLVGMARQVPGVLGSRMMGGGFGGCTLSLVATSAVATFETALAAGYEAQFGRTPTYYHANPAEGATVGQPGG